jgi:hypothetical protein
MPFKECGKTVNMPAKQHPCIFPIQNVTGKAWQAVYTGFSSRSGQTMNSCKILRLDPARRRKAASQEPAALSAIVSDGVMHFPLERRQADVHDCDEMHARRRHRQSGGA